LGKIISWGGRMYRDHRKHGVMFNLYGGKAEKMNVRNWPLPISHGFLSFGGKDKNKFVQRDLNHNF
jgi:hypothetical protein